MLNSDTFELIEASREARGYELRCKRVLKRGINEKDYGIFYELGEDFINYSNGITKGLNGKLMGNLLGANLAIVIEGRWLRTNKGPYSENGEKLRELGVDSLKKLGEILKNPNSPEFIGYVPAMIDFFKGYREWAEEELATESEEKIPNYRFPPTELEVALGAKDL